MSPATVMVALSSEALAALDRHIVAHGQARTRAELVAEIVAQWATAQGGHGDGSPPDEGLRPEQLNASNDS